jgi:hypothetical protein
VKSLASSLRHDALRNMESTAITVERSTSAVKSTCPEVHARCHPSARQAEPASNAPDGAKK